MRTTRWIATNNALQPDGRGTLVRSPVIALSLGQESIADGDGNPDTDCTVDFGFWSGFTVGNLVWHDANDDGLRGAIATEPGIAGIGVELMLPGTDGIVGGTDDITVSATTTDQQRSLRLPGLRAGHLLPARRSERHVCDC